MTPSEYAEAIYGRFKDVGSLDKVAEELKLNPARVRQWIDFRMVPKEVQDLVDAKKVDYEVATNLFRQNDPELAKETAFELAKKERPKTRQKRVATIAAIDKTKPVRKIIEEVDQREEEKLPRVTLRFEQQIYRALEEAAKKQAIPKKAEELAEDIIEDWLRRAGFLGA